jgi:hypothetical protein
MGKFRLARHRDESEMMRLSASWRKAMALWWWVPQTARLRQSAHPTQHPRRFCDDLSGGDRSGQETIIRREPCSLRAAVSLPAGLNLLGPAPGSHVLGGAPTPAQRSHCPPAPSAPSSDEPAKKHPPHMPWLSQSQLGSATAAMVARGRGSATGRGYTSAPADRSLKIFSPSSPVAHHGPLGATGAARGRGTAIWVGVRIRVADRFLEIS